MLRTNDVIAVQLSKNEFVHIKAIKPDVNGLPRSEGYYYKFDKKDWPYGYKRDGKKVIVKGFFPTYRELAEQVKKLTLGE